MSRKIAKIFNSRTEPGRTKPGSASPRAARRRVLSVLLCLTLLFSLAEPAASISAAEAAGATDSASDSTAYNTDAFSDSGTETDTNDSAADVETADSADDAGSADADGDGEAADSAEDAGSADTAADILIETAEDAEDTEDTEDADSADTGDADSSGTDADTDTPYADDELIIVYEEDALGLDDELELSGTSLAEEQADEITLEELGVSSQEEIISADDEQGAVTLVQLDGKVSVEELAEELSADPAIAYAQPNYSYSLLETTTNDTYMSTSASTYQYYLYSSSFTDAWDYSQANNTVTVAVIDTGCNLSHADLAANINTDYAYDVPSETLLKNAGVSNNGDSYGHGTMVCGIISGYANNGVGIAGASYNADILPIRIYDNNNSADTTDILLAYAYLDSLIDNDQVTNICVINMSLGYYSTGTNSYDYAVQEAIASMLDEHDVLTVCAGGNSASTSYIYPADFEECISVTSVDSSGATSSFSDYNDAKDISAYGEDIRTTSSSGGYSYSSGTSLAAPQVAAAVALMFAANPTLSAAQAASILTSTASKITGNNKSGDGSAGILDAETAVLAALSTTGTSSIDKTDTTGSSSSSSSSSSGSSSSSSSSSSGSSSSSSSVTAPGKVTISSATLSSSLTKVTLKWKKVSGASGYEIYRSVSGGSYKKVKTITSGSTLSWSNSGLSLGKTYRYKIRAYTTSGSTTKYGSYSSVKAITTKPSAVTLSSAKTTSAGNVTVTWKKLSSASGYQIYRSTNGGSYKKVKTITSGSTVSWTDKTVKAGRVYRYKVRAYKKSGSTTVTGSYSSAKKITAKPGTVTITSVSSKKSRTGTIKWKKVSGATGYQIAYRRTGSSTWHYITVKSTSRTITKLLKKNYYVKVRAYTTYNGKKYYGSYSSKKLMKVK